MNGLLFIRHAETDLAGTFCGHSDPPINTRGYAQVNNLIAQLSSEPFDAIYSSDLRRATDTAAALAQAFHVPCLTSPNLREIHFGDWESLTWEEIKKRDPDYAQRWADSFPAFPAPGGEVFADFEQRVLHEMTHLFRLATNKRIAVVTHGGVMRVVLRTFLGHTEQEAWELTRPYCSFFSYAGVDRHEEVSR